MCLRSKALAVVIALKPILKPVTLKIGMKCKTCQEEATVHIDVIGCHFCESCLAKIDARLQQINFGLCQECGGTTCVDSGGFTPWGSPISIPCPSCHMPELKECATIGASWKLDSSLEKRFPITAENITFQELQRREIDAARSKHKPINSAHEGYAVILEELDEFWQEVRKKRSERSPDKMVSELVQVAAMAQRTAEDVLMS